MCVDCVVKRLGQGMVDIAQIYGGLNWIHFYHDELNLLFNLSNFGCPQDLKSFQTNSGLGGGTHIAEFPCSHCPCCKGRLGHTSLFRCSDCKRVDPLEVYACGHSEVMDSVKTAECVELGKLECLKGMLA